MGVDSRLRASFLAAAVAGVPVLLVFFVWHWFYIAPVWSVLVEGLAFVAVAALGIGWAWAESRRAGRFEPPWGGLAFGGVFAAGLAVGEAVGWATGREPVLAAAADLAVQLPLALIPGALVTIAGWRLVGNARGAAAYGLASLVLLLYVGGGVGVGRGLGLFLVLFPSYLVAGAVVGALEPRFARAGRAVV